MTCIVWHVLYGMYCMACNVWHVLYGMYCMACIVWHVLYGMYCMACIVWHVLYGMVSALIKCFLVYAVRCDRHIIAERGSPPIFGIFQVLEPFLEFVIGAVVEYNKDC